MTGAADPRYAEEAADHKYENDNDNHDYGKHFHFTIRFFCLDIISEEITFISWIVLSVWCRGITADVGDRSKLVNAELGPVTPCRMEANKRAISVECQFLIFHPRLRTLRSEL